MWCRGWSTAQASSGSVTTPAQGSYRFRSIILPRSGFTTPRAALTAAKADPYTSPWTFVAPVGQAGSIRRSWKPGRMVMMYW